MKDWITQQYACCQIISYLNAAIFHDMDVPRPDTPEFEELVDLAGCRHGSATRAGETLLKLKLDLEPVDLNMHYLRRNVPVDFTMWLAEWGFHNALLINVGHEFEPNSGYPLTFVNLAKDETTSVVGSLFLGGMINGTIGRNVGGHIAMRVVPRGKK